MSERRRSAAGPYARAVERSWAELCGRAVILSPRDWALVDEWHRRGIPLQIIQEAIAAAAERRSGAKPSEPPRGLSYIAPAVEDAWRVILEGRLSDPVEDDSPGGVGASDGPPIERWRACMEREAEGSALRRLLGELIEAHHRDAPLHALEARLDAELSGAAPAELRRRVEEEVAEQLNPYRNRMKPEVLESTRRRAVAARLRDRLGLPELTPAGER
jgi:hypothetical protein